MGKVVDSPESRAVVNHVSPRSLMVYSSTENAPKCELTNLLLGFDALQTPSRTQM